MTVGNDYGDEPTPTLALGLRALLVSGERLRGVLAREVRLGPSDLNALGHVYTDGPITPRELGDRMDMTSGTITALLDRLEKAGFLTRSVNPHDRRSLHISLSPAGHHALQGVHDTYEAAIREAGPELPDFSDDQIASLLAVLSRALAARATSGATTGHSAAEGLATPPRDHAARARRGTGPRLHHDAPTSAPVRDRVENSPR
jgi:DNA-binding MarR family transcriptional regulator